MHGHRDDSRGFEPGLLRSRVRRSTAELPSSTGIQYDGLCLCMCRVTKLDRIRNERIRATTKVEEISEDIKEGRLKWYGHVMQTDEHCVGRRAMGMEVHGQEVYERATRTGSVRTGYKEAHIDIT